ncbi:MAG TPA: zinc-dependent metalloprotease, partial [Capillimicrobium sp.]
APNAGILTGPLRNLGGAVLAAEVGGLTGLLAQRVLGQFDLVLLDSEGPTRLLFVAPNLLETADKLDVDAEQLVHWVTFHEVTHAVQFTSVPWLREHLGGMLSELLESADVKIDWKAAAAKLPSRDDLESLVQLAREEGLVMVLAGPERRDLLDRLQATMAVIEGHAEHVMDAVGRDALSDLDDLRAALDRRRASKKSGAWKVLEKLLGLEMKMKQYEVGKKFCDRVVELEGVERLHTVFSSPAALPTWAELQDPESWLNRPALPSAA